MATSYVAPAAQHIFGVYYAKGDPVDVSGWPDRAITEALDRGWITPASSAAGVTPVAKTSDYTAVNGDAVLADATAGAVTIALPAPSAGATVWIKKTDATGNAVTIVPHAAERIDTAVSLSINVPQSGVSLYCDGTDWWVF